MRITRRQAEANKARVVESAAALFRAKGFDHVNIADLMQAAGLTHGGFYNHFGSKDALEAEACAHIFEKAVAAIAAVADLADPARARRPSTPTGVTICRRAPATPAPRAARSTRTGCWPRHEFWPAS